MSSNLNATKSPNDPSSPTAESNVQSAATALSAVGCSGLLGGDNVALKPQTVPVSQNPLN